MGESIRYKLKRDTYGFQQGSVFEMTYRDDGMWSNCPFVAGVMIDKHGNKQAFSCSPKDVSPTTDPIGGVAIPHEPSRYDDDYMNPLNHP